MLFNSYQFIFVFLPVTLFIYFYLNHKKLIEISKGFLVFSSLFFYSWWNFAYLPIIVVSLSFNFLISKSFSNVYKYKNKSLYKKSILFFGITLNLSLLGYFKYVDFFIENFNFTFGSNIEPLNLLLPLAISFFTFQQIAYLVDSYRQITKEFNFLNYALFVTFFPQLIAGPIVHHKEMMPQFTKIKNKFINYRNISIGLFIFSIGLFKKIVIADTFSIFATSGFDTATSLNLFEAWATSLSYTFQLYFDFSGYTDMAIGLALLFNIKLPINFFSPYKATNIQDFWRRWHITLSRFLRDYIYIPLGGNKNGEFRTYSNLMATFLIGGLWHGAGWTFVFWGLLHGMAIIVQKIWNKLGIKIWTWVAWLITFNFINIAWIFFRAKEWDDAIKVLSSMFSLNNIVLPYILEKRLFFLEDFSITFGGFIKNINPMEQSPFWNMMLPWILLIGFIIVLLFKNSNQKIQSFKFNLTHIFSFCLLWFIILTIFIYRLGESSEFLYFNF